MKTLLAHGAEAKIYHTKQGVLKDRITKNYRHPELDVKLRRTRTKTEARLLTKAREAGIPVPRVIQQTETTLTLEKIRGKKLAEILDKTSQKEQIADMFGQQIAQLHNSGIIHGDLTTSNILYTAKKELVFIDFGLGYASQRTEDKATDIHVLKEALEAKHYQTVHIIWPRILKAYAQRITDTKVLAQLTKVEARGRYKQQY
jgi:Kae1-associated kinase Bud32